MNKDLQRAIAVALGVVGGLALAEALNLRVPNQLYYCKECKIYVVPKRPSRYRRLKKWIKEKLKKYL